jgi:S1-C subfamily serine protease
VAAAVVIAVIAGIIGGGIGAAVAHRHSSSSANPASRTPAPSLAGPPTTNNANSAAVSAIVGPCVVDVTSTLGYQKATAAGTGMVISSNGEILTNNHVINGATKVSIQIDGQGRLYPAKVVGTDPSEDIAVVQASGVSNLKTCKLGDSSRVTVGTPVVAIGNALNLQGPPTVTDGIITAVNQSITAGDPGGPSENLSGLFETNAVLRPGDSGGPLANGAGEVIGMDTAASGGRFRSGSSTGFAIPLNKAKSVADQIMAGKASNIIHIGPTAFLGVQVVPAGGVFGSGGSGNGVSLSGVVPNTPAQSAGLASGDTILAIDGKTVTAQSDLTQVISSHHPGDRVQVVWADPSGQHHNATVQLAIGPAD